MQKINKFFLFGSLFIFAGLALFSYNLLEDYRVGRETDLVKERLEKISMQTDEAQEERAYSQAFNKKMPTATIDSNKYIGYIIIPSLNLELPVLDSWSYPKLKIAPARYSGSIYTDDMILLAHNFKVHFGKLDRLKLGDKVEFRDVEGELFSFYVKEKEVLSSRQVEEMSAGDWDLTLFTCTLSGETRTTIRCKKLEARP